MRVNSAVELAAAFKHDGGGVVVEEEFVVVEEGVRRRRGEPVGTGVLDVVLVFVGEVVDGVLQHVAWVDRLAQRPRDAALTR